MKRIAIVGLPNSGKSQLFNSLTGAYDIVSNYPLTTVEVASRTCREEEACWEVLDTPGIHGLYIQSEEELVTRTLLSADPPDVVVQCADAHRLKESLLLTADLTGLGIPLVVVLTAAGESARRGRLVDPEALSRSTGLPVVSSPTPGAGIPELRRALLSASAPPVQPDLGEELEKAISRIQSALPPGCPSPRVSAVLLLENDPTFRDGLARMFGPAETARTEAEAQRVRASLAGRAPLMLASRRNRWVDEAAGRAERFTRRRAGRFPETFAALCRHPLYGLPILAAFLALIYLLVVYVAGALSLFLTTAVTDPVVSVISRLLPEGFWRSLLIGSHGVLTLGLFNSLTTVLPILTVFFLVFGALEDIGYLPNLAILTRRVSAKLGITGNAVIPLVLGFGCKTMATMTARTLPSRREKLIVVSLIAFAIPCSAQMGLAIAILGQHGIGYFAGAFGFLVAAEVIAGLVLNRILPKEDPGFLIQELPPIRLPRPSAVIRKTAFRLLWFLREAIPIFLIAALVMFLIDAVGFLAILKRVLDPFMVHWLGLPVDMVDALLLTLARSEAAAGLVLKMSRDGLLTGVQSIVAVVLLTTFAQCFANIAAMFKEIGARAALVAVACIYTLSFAYTGAVHEILSLVGKVVRI